NSWTNWEDCTQTKSWTLSSGDGTKTVYYQVRDKAGNIKETSDSIILDTSAPTISISGAPTSWINQSATASVSCSDNYECDSNSFKIKIYDNNPGSCSNNYNEYTLNSPQTIDNYKWVCGAGKDKAGNIGFSSPVEFKIDKTIPDISNIYAYTNSTGIQISSNIWQTDGSPYFNWTKINSLSGVIYYYTEDGTEPSESSSSTLNNYYDHSTTNYSEGTTIFKVKAKTNAGSWGITKEFILKYDGSEPFVGNINSQYSTIYRKQSTIISCTAYDVYSGLAENPKLRIQKSNGEWLNISMNAQGNNNYQYQYRPTISDPVGIYNIHCTAKDNVGFENKSETIQINVLNNKPKINSFIVSPQNGAAGITEFKIEVSASDIEDNTQNLKVNISIYYPIQQIWKNYTANYNSTSGMFEFIFISPSTEIGTFSTKAYVIDNDNDVTESNILTFTTLDIQAPRWNNNSTYIPSEYSSNTFSIFNITWEDENGVDKVLFESNFSGVPQNYTMIRISGNEKSGIYQFKEILPAGTYYWKSYANDSYGNMNSTYKWIFTINKADTSIKLYLNGNEWTNDISVTYPFDVDVNGVINVSSLQSEV
ncbi:MAG: hypothetical protein QXO19_03915, partial [Candidatus Aenigmatarchaeota archaeon]